MGLKKQDRLKSSKKIKELITNGKVIRGAFVSFYYMEADETQAAFMVSKKTGNAVHRNKIKRWLRELYIENKFRIKRKIYIGFLVNKRSVLFSYIELKKDIENIFNKFEKV